MHRATCNLIIISDNIECLTFTVAFIYFISSWTFTRKASRSVDTFKVHITVIRTICTLIHIYIKTSTLIFKPNSSGRSRILKGGFRCPERFRLCSCTNTRRATHAHKMTKKGVPWNPRNPPRSATE